MRREVAWVLLAAVVAACGDSDDPGSTSGITSSSVTSSTFAEPSTTSTRAVAPDATNPPTTSTPDTGVVESTVSTPEGAVTLGAPDPALLSALPSDAIDWTAVGPGWLLIDHPMGHGGPFVEPTTLDQRGLYLVAPDDTVYGVSALPSDGSRIVAVSNDGRQVLLESNDQACADGCSCPDDAAVMSQAYGLVLLDLTTTGMQPVIDPVPVSVCRPGVFRREAEFTANGRGIWVSETWYTDDSRPMNVRLSRVELITGAWVTIIDEPVAIDETAAPSSWSISVVELVDGRIVTTTDDGAWLREADGAAIRELDTPGTSCTLDRAWGADDVVARCMVPVGEFPAPPEVPTDQCRTSGLWSIPLDGSVARPLAIPFDDRGYLQCWAGYATAEQIGDELAVQVGGDGCSDDVVLFSAEGVVTRWVPDFEGSCTESLFGVRNGAWLIGAWPEDGAGFVYEVTGDGVTRLELPSGQIIVL